MVHLPLRFLAKDALSLQSLMGTALTQGNIFNHNLDHGFTPEKTPQLADLERWNVRNPRSMSYSTGKGGQVTYTSSARRMGMNSAPMTRNGPGIAGYVNIAANFKGTGGIPAPPRKPRSNRRKPR
jgi:hypothetical protein